MGLGVTKIIIKKSGKEKEEDNTDALLSLGQYGSDDN
jgi:hypothetical protein